MEASTQRPPKRLAGPFIALGLVLSAWIIASPLREMKAAGQTMSVTGSATRVVRSDFVVWQSRVRVRGENLPAAYASLTEATARVRKYFTQRSIPDSALVLPPIQVNPIKRPNPAGYGTTEEIIAYELVQNFDITSSSFPHKDIDFLLATVRDSTRLLESGIFFEADAPQFFFTGLEALKVELIGEATTNAKKRAEAIAAATGASVGHPRGARIGVFQLRPVHSTEVSDEGMLDTSSLEKEAMAVVTISFSIR